MIGTVSSTTTKHGRVLSVEANGRWIFKTLDDCFGMDRIRDWAKKNSVVLVEGIKAA